LAHAYRNGSTPTQSIGIFSLRYYSYRKVSTGFAVAAFIALTPTVSNAARHSQGKSGNVDERVNPVLDQISESDSQVIPKH
jgi:hypothetical protein